LPSVIIGKIFQGLLKNIERFCSTETTMSNFPDELYVI